MHKKLDEALDSATIAIITIAVASNLATRWKAIPIDKGMSNIHAYAISGVVLWIVS